MSSDPDPDAAEVLKIEFETRLLLRTWLNDEDVRRTGVPCTAFFSGVRGEPSAGFDMRSGDQPVLLLARMEDLRSMDGDVERAWGDDDGGGERGLLIDRCGGLAQGTERAWEG